MGGGVVGGEVVAEVFSAIIGNDGVVGKPFVVHHEGNFYATMGEGFEAEERVIDTAELCGSNQDCGEFLLLHVLYGE